MKAYKSYIYGLLEATILFLVFYLILHSLYDDFIFPKSLIKGINCEVIGMWLPVFGGILFMLFMNWTKKLKKKE